MNKLKVLENTSITSDIKLLKLKSDCKVKAGQFFMMKLEDMTLYRPISIFDSDDESISFLYMIRGSGTKKIAGLRPSDEILIHGPYGNGFEKTEEKLALVGGGIGMAPLYLTAKDSKNSKIYIGLRENRYTKEEINNIKSLFKNMDVYIKEGGSILDDIPFDEFDIVYSCGPEGMMKAIASYHNNTYVSLENHMGCGVGACLSCSCKTKEGMKKVCKDGPVFKAEEVYYEPNRIW